MGEGFLRAAAIAVLIGLAAAVPAAAQPETGQHRFGDDVYAGGMEVRVAGTGIEDVYAAGETVTIDAAVGESVHAAGRRVRIAGPVGADLYGAGYDVDVAAPVGGDVVAAGYRVAIGPGATIGGDAVIAARTVVVGGPIAGNADLSGETVEIAAPITGSVQIRASTIRFGEGARIDGTLTYRSGTDPDVPADVVPADRIQGTVAEDGRAEAVAERSAIGVVLGWALWLLVLAAIGALLAWAAPAALAGTRSEMAAHPWRTLLLGLVAGSALTGVVLVLGLSIIGLPLVPVAVVLIPILLLIGYLTGAHAIGRSILARARPPRPETVGAAVAAMLLGLVVLALLGLIPILGWIIAMLATIAGLGGWLARMLGRGRPATA